MLAAQKAGAKYLPLDSSLPISRQAELLARSDARILIAHDEHPEKIASPISCPRYVLNAEFDALREHPGEAPQVDVDGKASAYILFTSGSTGIPKGVECTHIGVTNLLADMRGRAPIDERDHFGLWTSLSFDVSVYEIYSALTAGGTLFIAPDSVRADPERYYDWLNTNSIVSGYIPPFMLKHLSNAAAISLHHSPFGAFWSGWNL